MAIQSPYTSIEYGLSAPEAYTKLANFYVENIEPKYIAIKTETFYDSTARTSSKKPIGTNAYQMPWAETFTFADIYAFIKEQPEFEDAVDVI